RRAQLEDARGQGVEVAGPALELAVLLQLLEALEEAARQARQRTPRRAQEVDRGFVGAEQARSELEERSLGEAVEAYLLTGERRLPEGTVADEQQEERQLRAAFDEALDGALGGRAQRVGAVDADDRRALREAQVLERARE